MVSILRKGILRGSVNGWAPLGLIASYLRRRQCDVEACVASQFCARRGTFYFERQWHEGEVWVSSPPNVGKDGYEVEFSEHEDEDGYEDGYEEDEDYYRF